MIRKIKVNIFNIFDMNSIIKRYHVIKKMSIREDLLWKNGLYKMIVALDVFAKVTNFVLQD